MPSFAELRARHPTLTFEACHAEVVGSNLVIKFWFTLAAKSSADAQTFQPSVVIQHVPDYTSSWLRTSLAQKLILQLGMIELVSYWKVSCPPEVIIRAGELSTAELAWWRETWISGLGEFWYRNELDPSQPSLLNFSIGAPGPAPAVSSLAGAAKPPFSPRPKTKRLLIPVGGGKDSAALLGWLAEQKIEFGALLLEPHSPAAAAVTQLSQATETIKITRTLDQKLKKLNAAGYLNGHTPFSAYLGWVSVLAAELFGYALVAVANEQSANEANAVYHGLHINHQYSKTTEYEARFRTFLETEFKKLRYPLAQYFSIWRPLHELEIAEIFSHYPQFFTTFKSCNVNQRLNTWCHKCSKCVFVYTILAPFIERSVLAGQIFDHDLFENVHLVPTWKQLLGFEANKPFECVGTKAEILAALAAVIDQHEQNGEKLPAALAELLEEPVLRNSLREVMPAGLQAWLHAFTPPHFLPADLEQFLRKQLQTEITAEQIETWRAHPAVQALVGKKLVLLGLGREGWASYYWLRQVLPTQEFVLGDAKPLEQLPEQWQGVLASDPLVRFVTGPEFLKMACVGADYLWMTPGMRTDQKPIQVALKKGAQLYSQTQLFFDICPAKIIGITGTKGKSTTSSLIYHVLQKNGVPTVLVGNIGTPALTQLPRVTPETWVVAEMSSHQLQHLTKSPQVAVIQNITSEHLDYYPDTAAYVQAKAQIARFQTTDNFVIYDPAFETPKKLARLGKAQPLLFAVAAESNDAKVVVRFKNGAFWLHDHEVIKQTELPLLGDHNLANVAPAIIVGNLVGLKPAGIKNAIKSFTPLQHRLQLVHTTETAKFYDDSLSTTPEATIAALSGFKDQNVILLAGGYERHQDFSELATAILTHEVKGLVLFPTTGVRLKANVETAQHQLTKVVNGQTTELKLPEMHEIQTMVEAVAAAKKLAAKLGHAIILLSPASASFNSFKDYHDRGLQFAAAAKA